MNTQPPDAEFPRFFQLRQRFPRPRVADIRGEVEQQLASLDLASRVRPGDSVAVTAGSRGIADIVPILAATVRHLRNLGTQPFLVPAMGSHGGATADGQLAVLSDYGITEAACECPVRSSMETDLLFESSQGIAVHADRLAHAADHVFVVGRIKPHTSLTGRFQSGLCKMLIIGLGKRDGAQTYHAAMADHRFDEIVAAVVPQLVTELGVCGGLAILENAHDETARLEAAAPNVFLDREPDLLEEAAHLMPRLPFDNVDVLIIDEIGKDISGSGLDTNIVGRKFDDDRAIPGETPVVRRIVALSLTPASHGNALGIGITEFVTRRLVEKIDAEAMRMNGIVSGHLGAAKIPPVLETDREAIAAAVTSLTSIPPREAKVIRIKNTLKLDEVTCSETYRQEAERREDLTVGSESEALTFEENGRLP